MIKQVIVVRTDLGMGKGKIAAQVGHAAILAAEHVRKTNKRWYDEWWPLQAKIVLKIDSLDKLESIRLDGIRHNLPCIQVRDAGHTQIKPNTVTCIAIGPVPEELVDPVTKDLKLL